MFSEKKVNGFSCNTCCETPTSSIRHAKTLLVTMSEQQCKEILGKVSLHNDILT